MSEREDPWGRTLFEREDPDATVLEVAPGQRVCDFCIAGTPTWLYPCGPVKLVGNPVYDASDDEWLACDRCHELIEAGDERAMVTHMVRGQSSMPLAPGWQHPPMRRRITTATANLRAFLDARTGPARPWSET